MKRAPSEKERNAAAREWANDHPNRVVVAALQDEKRLNRWAALPAHRYGDARALVALLRPPRDGTLALRMVGAEGEAIPDAFRRFLPGGAVILGAFARKDTKGLLALSGTWGSPAEPATGQWCAVLAEIAVSAAVIGPDGAVTEGGGVRRGLILTDPNGRQWIPDPPLGTVGRLLDLLAGAAVSENGLSALAEVVEAVRPRKSANAARGLVPVAAAVRDLRREDPALLSVIEAPEPRSDRLTLFDGMVPTGPAIVVPCVPLVVFDRTGLDPGRGRGAPLTLASSVELLSESPGRRFGSDPMTFTLREWIPRLWPGGWDRRRNLPALLRAFQELDAARILVPNGYGGWTALRPFLFRHDLPPNPTLADSFTVEIQIPPALGVQAVLIDRRILRRDRPVSAPRYRAELGIRKLWDKYGTHGGTRILATVPEVRRGRGNVILNAHGNPVLQKNGSPVTAWNDRRAVPTGRRIRNPAADRIPVLDGDSLAALAYNPEGWQRLPKQAKTERRRVAAEVIRAKEAAGDLVIEEATLPKSEELGWRILEPWTANASHK